MLELKRLAALFIIGVIIVVQGSTLIAFASEEVNVEYKYLAIEAVQTSYNNGLTIISGEKKTVNQVENLNDGILTMMYGSDTLNTSKDYVYNGNSMTITDLIYSESNISLYCNDAKLNNIIVAEKDISINCTKLESDDLVILYSKNGNININVSSMEFRGIIYAPNGTVTFNASNVDVEGAIICNKLITNTSKFTCKGSYYTQNLIELFRVIRNDTILDAKIRINNDDNFVITYTSNKEIKKTDVYVRYNNAETFEYYQELNEEGIISITKEFEFLDIALIGQTVLGESVKSSVETFTTYMENVEYYYADTDEDGISDGDEIWLMTTDPYSADTDGDGFSDYYECFVMFTDPTKFTEDIDLDGDGVLTSIEMQMGTNPRLCDSDFDGINDSEDEFPTKFSSLGADIDGKLNVGVGAFDKVTTTLTNDLKVVKTIYDPINRVTKLLGNGEIINSFFYDMLGRKIADIVEYNNDFRINVYSYDDNDNIAKLVNNNDIYSFEYDENETVQKVSINGTSIVEYDVDTKSIVYGNGQVLSVDGDEESNVYKKYVDNECVAYYIADEFGEVFYYHDIKSDISYTYEYDDEFRIVNINTNVGFSSLYDYDYEKMTVTYSDGVNVMEEIIYNEVPSSNISLISDDVLNKYKIDNVLSYKIDNADREIQNTRYVYDENDKIVSVNYLDGTKYEYEYTLAGQISKVLINGVVTNEYVYSSNGQLFKEVDLEKGTSCEYFYDLYNNIIKTVEYLNNDIENKETIVYEYSSHLWKDVLTSYAGKTIEYDSIGNPVKYYDGSVMEWEGTMLKSVKNDSLDIMYSYNETGIRTYKNVNGVETLYFIEGKDIVAEKTGDDVIWYIYDDKNEVFGFIFNNETFYYDKNVSKDVVRIVDADGNCVCTYNYDAWGNVTTFEGNKEIAELNPIRYRSYYFDNETGRYYLSSRYYDSETKRFISIDNVSRVNCNDMDTNLYAYCGGDPVNLYDPTGMASRFIAFFTIPELEGETDDLRYAVSKSINTSFLSTYKCGSTKEDFETWWNRTNGCDIAFISTHGEPAILCDKKIIVTKTDVDNLKYVNIKLLVILSCNTGHIDVTSSIAKRFANRITGKVIASDGTVCGKGGSSLFKIFFESRDDEYFQQYVKGASRTNYGWLVFVGLHNSDKDARVYNLGIGKGTRILTVSALFELIDSSKLYNSYK